jgi:hypothetical protein
MSTLEECAQQVRDNVNSGTCPNNYFEYDPNDGDCDCCADEDFNNGSTYTLYELSGTGAVTEPTGPIYELH